MIHALYSVALSAALLGYAPVLLARRLAGRGHPAHLGERLGSIGRGLPPEPRCWIHAVSVGESVTAIPLVEGIRRRWPELAVVLTTVTPTGARIVEGRLATLATHRYFPLDLPGPVGRALRGVRPCFFIGMETELWPNFFRALGRRGVPGMIANGRISDRSFRRYRRVRVVMRRVLAQISIFAMQSQEDARRIIALGAPPERVVVTGSLKADQEPEDPGARDLWERLLGLAPGERVWIAGSTHPGEEETVAEAFQRLSAAFPELTLLLAPRHPERVPEVERLLASRGLVTVRRSQLPRKRGRRAVIVLDTVGELAQLYRVAELVFVGGSLVPRGGHNMLEPALRMKPVLFGPHTGNFRESAELLTTAGGALVVRDGAELERAAQSLLDDPGLAKSMGEAAFQAVVGRQGAVQATLDLIARYLYPKPSAQVPAARHE
ncbi:MAG: 3-deoxy-D-manno-octulosonic acid transferase [Candidatus Rokubacteria bacterium]|nr:3-deoxy-D-manno-octulosonic acid transferase [Candidatus Rokubacteria bacterium]MBI3105443.1 3-deoxy-D-manno-octulosonic acid transferase [Candidatus Rokubacteria bacterium]